MSTNDDGGKQRDGGGALDPWGGAKSIDPDGFDGGGSLDPWGATSGTDPRD